MTRSQLDIRLENGAIVRVQVLTPWSFRVRLSENGTFAENGLIRYGILKNDWSSVEFEQRTEDLQVIVTTTAASLAIDKRDGKMTFRDSTGRLLTGDSEAPWSNGRKGFGASFKLSDDEKLYGLGDVSRERIEKRGFKTIMWVRNVASYVPIPYVMSTRGWALFLNTTWRHFFDIGATDKDCMRFWGPQGELDYYLVAGADMPQLLDRYTDIAGKPHMLPLSGYALTFVCNQEASARDMLDDALNFRREGMPCDTIGLEPGWMSKWYDYTTEKEWHPERFYIPTWAAKGPQTFSAALDRLGFKLSLWMCCDYDLSWEEERRAGAAGWEPREEPVSLPDDFEQDAHFHSRMMDKITKPDEPWFKHLEQFVEQGASAFKLDGADQVLEHPDRKWGNGMDDEEMHNLYPTILNKQMHLGYKEQTGLRPMVYSSGGYAGIQQYSATWAGDTGGEAKPLCSMLNHGMSGHVNTSCDMHVFTPEGIHFGFLQSWSQICSWAYWRHPWLLDDATKAVFIYYNELRYRLLPYIYSMAHIASRTGMPIMRAMPLIYPDDPRSDELRTQYLFGSDFLVGAFTNEMHLPEGTWIDYWTGRAYTGPQDISVDAPEGRGGPLFVRAGAIIPTWPVMSYVGQKPVAQIGLEIFPFGQSSFTLYEDDGKTFAYQDGAVATTLIACDAQEKTIELAVGARRGEYEGMPETRSFEVTMHIDREPSNVQFNGHDTEWSYDAASQALHTRMVEDPDRASDAVLRCQY